MTTPGGSTTSTGPGRPSSKRRTRRVRRLWKLAIRTVHGRPAHPQTQGKVERFHRTLEEDWGEQFRQPSLRTAEREWPWLVREYNSERPHEACQCCALRGMQVPGRVYQPSARQRPDELPEATVSDQGVGRRVDASGKLRHGGSVYRVGMGLAKELVEVREENDGEVVYFAGFRIAPLNELRV